MANFKKWCNETKRTFMLFQYPPLCQGLSRFAPHRPLLSPSAWEDSPRREAGGLGELCGSCAGQPGILATCSWAPRPGRAGITGPVYSAGSRERGCVQGLINHGRFGRDKQPGPSGGADAPGWPERGRVGVCTHNRGARLNTCGRVVLDRFVRPEIYDMNYFRNLMTGK